MRKILFIVSPFVYGFSFAQSPSVDPTWQLVEEWNFKTMSWTQLNQDWETDPCDHALQPSPKVEPQYYQPENVSISAATGLKLTVKQETVYERVVCYRPDTAILVDGGTNLRLIYYTSGEIVGKFPVEYGYIESRIKLPYGYDFFPGFWTAKDNPSDSNGNEIDIFEMTPYQHWGLPLNDRIATCNMHSCYGCVEPDFHKEIALSSSYTNYHTYAVEWNPSRIIWYYDNEIVRIEQNELDINGPVHLLLNLALTPQGLNASQTTYPADMYVDYVRWYQLNNSDCNTIVDEDCAFYFGGYQPTVKKSISIGEIGNGCSNTQPANTNLVLRATDFVQLNGSFTVPVGSSLYIDVNPCY